MKYFTHKNYGEVTKPIIKFLRLLFWQLDKSKALKIKFGFTELWTSNIKYELAIVKKIYLNLKKVILLNI